MAWRSRGRRGDLLEDLLLLTNEFYNKNNYARVDKIATPIKAVEINSFGQIVKGYFEKKATVDFIGICQGIPICFDAKETNLKSLPLSNIHSHQLEYMIDFKNQGGLSFMIVNFKFYDKYFLLPLELILKYVNEGKRKSIPYSAMEDAFEIHMQNGHYLNYLPCISLYLDTKKETI